MADSALQEEAERGDEFPLESGEEPSIFPKDDDENIIGENGLALQIAIDSLAMGNLEPLKRHCKP
jgi:hypothetical protein